MPSEIFQKHSDLWTRIDTRMVDAEKKVLPRELQLEGLFKKVCNFITLFNAHCNIVCSVCLKYTFFASLSHGYCEIEGNTLSIISMNNSCILFLLLNNLHNNTGAYLIYTFNVSECEFYR